MKLGTTAILSCLLVFFSCEKGKESHLDRVTRKITDFDETAFTGKWEHYKTIEYDFDDKSTEIIESNEIEISKRYWKSSGEKLPINLYHEEYCGAIYSHIVFLENKDSFLIHNWAGTSNEMYFKLYEYPENSNIMRVDKYYRPKL